MKYTKVINGKLLKIKHTKYNNASSLFDKSLQGRGSGACAAEALPR